MKAIPSIRSHLLALSGSAATLSLLAIAGLVSAGCTGGSKGDPENRGDFKVASISSGSGAVFPYRIRRTDSFGNPTSVVENIDEEKDLTDFVTPNNGVLPVATLPTTPVLPDGNPGNHFLHFTFSHKLQIESILSGLLADQANSGLTGALTILGYDPSTETSLTVKGRGFVNGFTYFNEGGTLRLVQAVEANGNNVTILDTRANGFPSYAGAADLVSLKSFVFIADDDGDLATLETFPSTLLLRITVTNAVRDSENDILEQEMAVATTVGPDPNPPQVLGYLSLPQISPGNNATGVDPTGTIQVTFNKPVQPGEVGTFFDPNLFTPPAGGVSLFVTLAAATFPVIYYANPISYADLTRYTIRPAYSLPGQSQVDVVVQETTITSLTGQLIGDQVSTSFTTGAGPGLINAPVAPEAIYVGIGGAEPGVSVIDLNGFGQGTGDPAITRWPLNPNIGRPGVIPSLAPGTSSLDAGGAGVLTLTQDTNGNTRLLRDPLVGEISDLHLGAPLDLIFNNENINVNARRPNQVNEIRGATGSTDPGNTITQPPHPNPPRLIFPPPNPNRAIFGEEPTVKTSAGAGLVTGGPPAGCLATSLNFLGTGNPFSSIENELGVYGTLVMGTFPGPQPPPGSPPPPTPFCPFTSRQQVGHFLYALDRDNRQIVVLNSNRFTVLDTIQLSDPVNIAMSPNMTRMAVSNFSSSSVAIIDINPFSATFHQVLEETRIESNPSGIAWQPDGEDILVVSTDANALTILSAIDFKVRRTLGGFLNGPIDVVVTERYLGSGNGSGVYYAYMLNSNGSIAIYESGPDGVNGFGFNDIIGNVTNVSFPRARAMMYDMVAGFGGIFVGHQDDSGLGQISRLSLTATPGGPQPLTQVIGGFILPPFYRQKEWTVTQRIGGNPSTGSIGDPMSGDSIVDICFDDLRNVGGFIGQGSAIGPAYSTTPYIHSGKHTIKVTPNGALVKAVAPRLMFVALSDDGSVDVYELQTGTKIRNIPVPGVRVVSNYWRQ